MAETNEARRSQLLAVAQRFLRNSNEAEDAVQETLLRFHQHQKDITHPDAWLITILTRCCLDRVRRMKRTTAEPISDQIPATPAADLVELSDELTVAFRHMLESLAPAERLAFLLREVFDYEYDSISELLNTSESNTRQIVHRAKRRLSGREQRFVVVDSESERFARNFADACRVGDLAWIETLFGSVTNQVRSASSNIDALAA